MATGNYELANDMMDDLMITVVNNAGAIVPAPAGDSFTALSSDTTMLNPIIATMPSGPDSGKPSLRMNAMKKLSTAPITVTVSDSAGSRARCSWLTLLRILRLRPSF